MTDPTIEQVLAASPDTYWNPIVTEIEATGRDVRHACLLNHQAAHLLYWAKLGREAAIQARTAAE